MCEKKLSNCKFVKTILMLFVILGHASAFWSEGWFNVVDPLLQSYSLSILCSWIGSFHVFGFSLVSGYIFAFKVLGGGITSFFHF